VTDEEIAQLAHELTPDEKTRLIEVLCGPSEDWDDAAGEFAMKLYGIDPNDPRFSTVALIEGVIRKFHEREEEVPESLLNVLRQLQEKSNKSPKE